MVRTADKRTSLTLIFFLASVLAAVVSQSGIGHSPAVRACFRFLLSAFWTLAGSAHFDPRMYGFYESMVFLPWAGFWIYGTGVAMVATGVMLVFPSLNDVARNLSLATLATVFPGNLACVFLEKPRRVVCGGSLAIAVCRLPFQYFFALWTIWVCSDANS